MKRIGKFLYASEIESYYIVSGTRSPNHAIEIRDGSFYWDLEKKKEDKNKTDDKQKLKERKFTIDTASSPDKHSVDDNPIDVMSPKSPASPMRIRRKQQFLLNGSENSFSDAKSAISDTVSDNDIKQSLLSEVDYDIEAPRHRHKKAIRNVNLSIPKGRFTMILGDIGSGKSSLLYSLLAEMKPEPGHSPQINIDGSIALVVQKAFIMSCSVEENILMSLPKNLERFNDAVHYACFKDDLKMMQDG